VPGPDAGNAARGLRFAAAADVLAAAIVAPDQYARVVQEAETDVGRQIVGGQQGIEGGQGYGEVDRTQHGAAGLIARADRLAEDHHLLLHDRAEEGLADHEVLFLHEALEPGRGGDAGRLAGRMRHGRADRGTRQVGGNDIGVFRMERKHGGEAGIAVRRIEQGLRRLRGEIFKAALIPAQLCLDVARHDPGLRRQHCLRCRQIIVIIFGNVVGLRHQQRQDQGRDQSQQKAADFHGGGKHGHVRPDVSRPPGAAGWPPPAAR